MRIGILQTGRAPEALLARGDFSDYPDLFRRLLAEEGFDFRTYVVVDMEFPDSVHDCDGWLITGSRHGAYEDHPFIPPLEAFIREAQRQGVPIVGICFGHQIMAQALGGKVEKFGGGWAVGPQDYDFGGASVTLNAWHQDQVTQLPPGARVEATSPFCAYAALSYGDTGFSVQAHPEFDQRFVEGLIETRGRALVPHDRLEAALSRKGHATGSDHIARRIAGVFRSAARRQPA